MIWILLALLSVASASREVSSRYLGQGAAETGIPGLPSGALLYRLQVAVDVDLRAHGWDGRTPPAHVAQRFLEEVARDYDVYPYLSALLRDAYGVRVAATEAPVTAPEYLWALLAAKGESGQHLLTSRRVRQLAAGLVDGYAVQRGALAGCRGDVHDLLWDVVGGSGGSSAQLAAALQAIPQEELRDRMLAVEPRGCENLGRRDYIFMSYGMGRSGQGWFVFEVDYTGTSAVSRAAGPNTRVIPFRQIAGTPEYCEGEFTIEVEPKTGMATLWYGYTIDMSQHPEHLAIQYHEQFIHDFVEGLLARLDARTDR